MPRENVEVFRQLLDAVSRRDLARLVELADAEIEWRSFFAALLPKGGYHGHDGLREYARDLEETWESLRAEVDDVFEGGDVAVGIGRVHFRGRGSGVETESPAGWMLKFRDGEGARLSRIQEPRPGAGSRRARGVGDVAGERGNRPPRVRGRTAT